MKTCIKCGVSSPDWAIDCESCHAQIHKNNQVCANVKLAENDL